MNRRTLLGSGAAAALGSAFPAKATLLLTGVGCPPASGGTSASRYSFAGTRFRPFSGSAGASSGTTNLYHVHQIISGSPAYATDNWYFYFANWENFSSATAVYPSIEPAMGNSCQYEALGFQYGGTVYNATGGYVVSASGVVSARASFPLTVPSGGGILIGPVTIGGAGMAANSTYRLRVAFNVPSGGFIGNGSKNAFLTGTGFTQQDATQGGTTSQAGSVTGGTWSSLTNTNSAGFNIPMFGIAQGGDGRPAILVAGDSIGFGVNDSSDTSSNPALWTSRGCFGYVERGLDDNATSKRLASFIMCCPGQGPNQWQTLQNWQNKQFAVQAVHDIFGDWPFDRILSQHGTNSVSVTPFASMMQSYWTTMTSNLGNKPISQIAMLADPDSSSDGYATIAGQTPSASNAYPSGNRWTFNASLAAGSFFPQVTDFLEPWKLTSVSNVLGSNCDRLICGSSLFQTTLASAYSGSGTISLNASPPIGAHLSFAGYSTGHTGSGFGAIATAVTGSGPYTVTLLPSGGSLGALSSGASVQELMHDTGGLHPNPYRHANTYPPAVIGWKQANGWV